MFLLLIVTNFVCYEHIIFFTMDVSFFSRTIKELILENDRVGVPRVGNFVAELMPATFSACRTMINPPYRLMSFSKGGVTVAERHLFLNKMEELSGMPPAQVAEEYDMFIKGFISNLESEKSVVLPSLGRMHATSTNEYFFVADEDLDIYPDGIGLEPVSIKAPDPDFVPVAPPEPLPKPELEVEQDKTAALDPEVTGESEGEVDEHTGVETQAEQKPESESQTDSESIDTVLIDPETIEDNEFVGVAEAETKSEPEPELVAEPDAEPVAEPPSDPKPWNEKDSSDFEIEPSKKRVGLWVVVIIIALVMVGALLLYIFRDSEWLSPLLDKILYSKEELRILGR